CRRSRGHVRTPRLSWVQTPESTPGRPAQRRSGTMTDETTTGGFGDAELAAMKQRAAELRAEGAVGSGTAKKKREAKACEDALAALEGSDHEIGNRLHAIVREEAPHLDPK